MVHMMQHLLQHEQHHRRRGHPFNRRISARVNLIISFFFVLQVVSIYVNGERAHKWQKTDEKNDNQFESLCFTIFCFWTSFMGTLFFQQQKNAQIKTEMLLYKKKQMKLLFKCLAFVEMLIFGSIEKFNVRISSLK